MNVGQCQSAYQTEHRFGVETQARPFFMIPQLTGKLKVQVLQPFKGKLLQKHAAVKFHTLRAQDDNTLNHEAKVKLTNVR